MTGPRAVPPGLVGVQHAPAAALAGLVGASNAAADAPPRVGLPSAPRPRSDGFELLWFDPASPPRVRRIPEWKKVLDRLESVPPERDEEEALDRADTEDRREVFEILARGIVGSEESFARALEEGVRGDGRFAARLVLLAGELQLDFDELETLRATLSAAKPHGRRTPELTESIENAESYVATPGLLSPPEVARELTDRIRAAFSRWPERTLPVRHLEDMVERVLLEKRAYPRREVFGGAHLLGKLFLPGSSTGIPAYLPDALAKKLPLYRRFRVRMIAEAHPQADQYEESSAALRPLALARVLAPR